MNWLDRFPLPLLTLLALWMAVAPIWPEPHVIEKLRMLGAGELTRPLDIFDLLLHGSPAGLLVWRVWREVHRRRQQKK
jgi:hypothetical protein